MSIFRSEEMSLCQLFIQPEALYSTVAKLGEAGVAQFKDLNHDVISHQRKYVSEVRRIDEMERGLAVIHVELMKDEIDIPEPEEDYDLPSSRDIIDLEATIEKNETEIKEISQNFALLAENQIELVKHRWVLEKVELFFNESTPTFLPFDDYNDDNHQLHVVTGIIDVERLEGFKRFLWRITMGNIFMKDALIEDSFTNVKSGTESFKTVFFMFFQGDTLKSKVKKICDGYRASTFPYSNDVVERFQVMKNLKTGIADMEMVLNQTKDHRRRALIHSATSYSEWFVKLRKFKAVFYTMNLFNNDVSQKCFVGECWVPSSDLQRLRNALGESSKVSNSMIPSITNVIDTKETPPTFHRTNKFTKGFQNLIDSYGVASYREVNPAFYTVITFPFLFSVMFGDIGHGLILAIVGSWMVLSETKLLKIKDEIFKIFFTGRYIILLMGLFSIYSGFIYNDIFAKSLNLFGSSWSINYNISTVMNNTKLQLNPSTNDLMVDRTYPMGVDPVWQVAENKILFLNSFKMKMSIIFGVAHMLFGLTISVINYNQFKKRSSIILEYVPRVIFLVLLFGYMVFMMFFKWIRYDPKSDQPFSPGCAPSVLVYFINMMLFKSDKALKGCEANMFPGQRFVQTSFVFIAVLCIPWMLAGKPLYIKLTRKRRRQAYDEFINLSLQSLGDNEEEEPMSEIWMHQAIHTIEYVLGTISHTASYLRLWALSLAHAQLSEVLWTKLMPIAFIPVPFVGPFLTFYIFFFWSSLTLGILVVIEGLSAFLHTLRLHWVEFMDKFYDGNGVPFEPFSFKTILNGENKQRRRN